jgi:hypothetical protein
VAGAIDVDAGVVDYNAGALLGEEDCYGAADAATGAGDYGVASLELVYHGGVSVGQG